MESAVPRWQEGFLLAFCQPGSGGGMGMLQRGHTPEDRRVLRGPEGYQSWIASAPSLVKVREEAEREI